MNETENCVRTELNGPVAIEFWDIPRALSDEALRLLVKLPMEEVERRLRMDGPAGHERPTDEQLDDLFVEIDGSGETQSWRAFARAVLARWGTAPQAAEEEVAELVAWLRETGELLRSDIQYRFDLRLFYRAAELLERQALRPIPVSERPPGPGDCLPWPDEPDETPWCWAFVKGPLGDDAWERRPVSCLTTYKPMHTHWLAAHDLPLPEFQ